VWKSLQTQAWGRLEPLLTVKGQQRRGRFHLSPIRCGSQQPVVIGATTSPAEAGTGLSNNRPQATAWMINTGRKYNLPVLCPVDAAAPFTREAGPVLRADVLKGRQHGAFISPPRIEAVALLKQESYRPPLTPTTAAPRNRPIFTPPSSGLPRWRLPRRGDGRVSFWSEWLPTSGPTGSGDGARSGGLVHLRQRTWGVPTPCSYHRDNGDAAVADSMTPKPDHIQAIAEALPRLVSAAGRACCHRKLAARPINGRKAANQDVLVELQAPPGGRCWSLTLPSGTGDDLLRPRVAKR